MEQRYTDTRSAKGEGVAVGCAAGWMTSGCLFVTGLILCATGIGAIIGVPLLLAAILAPIAGPLIGMANIKGPCPYCGSEVSAQSDQPGVDCPACKKRIVIRNKRFMSVD